MKKQFVARKVVGLVLGLFMAMGLAVPVLARPIAQAPSGMGTWYIDENNVLWGMGGGRRDAAGTDFMHLGDGQVGVRNEFVPIMENVASIAFVNDGLTL